LAIADNRVGPKVPRANARRYADVATLNEAGRLSQSHEQTKKRRPKGTIDHDEDLAQNPKAKK
jgi:hypothetical protein